MNQRKAICIYGASSEKIADVYKEAAFETGRLIAESGHPLICGGGRAGLMRCAIDGALSAGGEAIGVLPSFMIEQDWQHPQLTEMIVTEGMHPRKRTMADMSIAVIAFPGGVGTFDELMEIITWRQLGLFPGQVVILNVDGYYDPMLQMLAKAKDQRFMRGDNADLWIVAKTAADAVKAALAPVETTVYKYH